MKNLSRLMLAILVIVLLASCQEQVVKIACVGDSITAGAGHEWQSSSAYPYVLGQILGDEYAVINCGRSGATMLKNGNLPFWKCNEFANVFAFHPDVITIKLGTNDSKPRHWNAEEFAADYQSLIDTFMTIKPQPKIYLCLPVPAFSGNFTISDSIISHDIIPIVQRLSINNDLPIIDLYKALNNYSSLFPDGIHPNEEGSKIIAETLALNLYSSDK